MRGFLGVPAGICAGEPLEIGNHISFLYFTLNANHDIDAKIGTKLNMTTNQSSRHLKSASNSFNYILKNNQEKSAC